MPRFTYQGIDVQQQLVSGELEAEGVQQAIAELEGRGIVVQAIGLASLAAAVPAPPPAPIEQPSASRLNEDQSETLLRNALAAVIDRGRSIVPALRALAADASLGRQRRELLAVSRVLERGNVDEATQSLSTLPDYFLPLVSSAVAAKDPTRLLQGFLHESNRAGELQKRWWFAVSYPMIVICLALLVIVALNLTVLPTFRELFADFGLTLPTLTLWVISLSQWSSTGLIVAAFVAALIVVFSLINPRRVLPLTLGDWLSKRFRWTAGRSMVNSRLAGFSADLVQAGIDAPSALALASHVTGQRQRSATTRGGAIQPSTLLFAVQADVSAPARVRLLQEISACYAERAQKPLSWAHGLLGPLAVSAVGLIVGVIVLALFLPLVDLINNLSG